MFRLTQEIDFCYGHRLLNYSGKCRHLHGHNGRAVIVLSRSVSAGIEGSCSRSISGCCARPSEASSANAARTANKTRIMRGVRVRRRALGATTDPMSCL